MELKHIYKLKKAGVKTAAFQIRGGETNRYNLTVEVSHKETKCIEVRIKNIKSKHFK